MWKVSISTTPEAEDVVTELLSEALGRAATSYTDFKSGITHVTVFCERKPPAPTKIMASLRDGLTRIKNLGLPVGAWRIRAQKFEKENWAESWKRHFKPIEIGRALLIKPSWSKRRPQKGQGVIVLDPGLSFGTGQHPTTEFCLNELVRFRRKDSSQAFLDLGTGSGILAIAAAKLGYAPVHAVDFDPVCVRIARTNSRANAVSSRIRIVRQDVNELPICHVGSYDVICANLISSLLITRRAQILKQIRPGGTLILAGILVSEFDRAVAAYTKSGMVLARTKIKKEWQSGTFLAPH